MRRTGRETVDRERGHDHIKCIGRVSTVASRLGQKRKNFERFVKRTGPAVGNEQWQWVGAVPVLMNKMDVQAIELAVIVGKVIDLLLLNTPVEISLPVGNEILHIGELRAVLPTGTRYFIGPTRVLEPFAQ